jgi:periplasmic protein TonB
MFEDGLLESTGRLKTQSKYWMFGTFALNAGVLALMILLPLLHPEALPKTALTTMLIAPPPPVAQVVARTPAAQQQQQSRPVATTDFTAPSHIPNTIHDTADTLPMQPIGVMPTGSGSNVVGSDPDFFPGTPAIVVHQPKPIGPVRDSTGVESGNLIFESDPVYPPIARAAHITGAVILRAIISKSGMIENLTVQSGPVMLRQAALDGVRRWRYKPFLLNGEPTDVDTTITVNFSGTS